MTDKEMWMRIEAACARLDRIREGVQRGVRKVLLPVALGTGLALGGGACGGARTVLVDGGPPADSTAPPPQEDYTAPLPDIADMGADSAAPVFPMYAPAFPDDAGITETEADGPMDGLRYGTPFP